MTAPQPPLPHEYLMYLRDTKQNDLAAEYEQYLRETGQEHAIGQATRQAEYQSGRMGRRIARENQNEREQVEAQTAIEEAQSGLKGAATRGLGAVTSLARDIPGVEALSAGARSVVRGQPYAEALGDIRDAGESINPVSRTGLRMVGGGLASAAIPGSPALQGAAYGGAINALSADPDKTMGERVATGIAGGIFGGAVGKVADVASTGARALMAGSVDDVLPALKQARADAASPLYREAAEEGAQAATTPMSPALRNVLDEPDIAGIVDDLRGQRQFRGMDERDPRLLDALYKALSDAERRAQSPMAALDPKAVNTGRFAVENIQAAKRQVLDAISGDAGAPMPSYATAVREFAEESAPIEGFERGYKAMGAQVGARENPRRIVREGQRGLLEWLEKQGPEAAEAAAQGQAAYGKRRLSQAGVTGLLNPLRSTARNFLLDGGDAMRQVDALRAPNTQRSLLEYLRSAGVAGVTPDMNP